MNCDEFIKRRRELDLNEGEHPLTCPNTESDEAVEVLKNYFLSGNVKKYKEVVTDILNNNSNPNEVLYEFKDYFLGEDWYIVDSVGGRQANTIIVYEILKRFHNETLLKKLFKRRK